MPEINTIKTALEFLKDGQSAKIDNLLLECKSNVVKVIGWTQYQNIKNITQRIATQELQSIKEQFKDLMEKYVDLKNFISGKKVEYYLYFDDSGKGSVVIGKEIENVATFQSFIK